MQKWCGATLKKLTGSDDLTLAEFLYAEEIKDDEIAYITMYLGEKDEVRQFAADYIGRKRHDKGVGPDVEWKTSGKTIGKTMASGYGPPADDDDGFETAGGKKGRNRGGKKKGVDGSALSASPSSRRGSCRARSSNPSEVVVGEAEGVGEARRRHAPPPDDDAQPERSFRAERGKGGRGARVGLGNVE